MMIYSQPLRGCLAIILGFTIMAFYIQGAFAQTDESVKIPMLEEVVVTAQKHEENIQKVPITMQALTDEDLETYSVHHLGDLDFAIPGLRISSYSTTQPGITLRGIKHGDGSIGTDPSVGIYLDGVYTGRSGSSLMNLLDVERVEVLKGPQGALFGRSATAGAINIITKKPVEITEGSVLLRYGNYNKQRLESMLNLPVMNNLYFRVSGLYNTRNGFYENKAGGDDLGTEGNKNIRGALRWTPGDKTQITLSADYGDTEHDGTPAVSLNPDLSVGKGDAFGAIANDCVDSKETRILQGYTLNGAHNFDGFTLHTITEYREFKTNNREDSDGLADFEHYLDTHNIEKNRQFSQELRLSGNPDQFQWFLGASYHKESARQTHQVTTTTDAINVFAITAGLPIPTLTTDLYWQETIENEGEFTSVSTFSDLIWHATNKLDVTVGLRYTWDEKEFLWIERPNSLGSGFDVIFQRGPNNVDVTRENTWEKGRLRLALGYDISSDLYTYLTAANGYKAGGFGGLELNSEYDPETVTNYEIGTKSIWFDDTLKANISFFYYAYTNRQFLSFTRTTGSPAVPIFQTITGDMRGQGAELETTWLATRSLNLMFNGIYNDIRWEDYTTAGGSEKDGEPSGEPPWHIITGLDYTTTPKKCGVFKFHMDYSYTENEQKEKYGDSKKITNARLTWLMMKDRSELSLWVKNLFDEESIIRYNSSWQDVLDTTFIARDEPQTFGVDYRYIF